jgi:hypothetical protein
VPTEALPVGANGLRFHNGALWASNFNKGTLLRAPGHRHRRGRSHPPCRGRPAHCRRGTLTWPGR